MSAGQNLFAELAGALNAFRRGVRQLELRQTASSGRPRRRASDVPRPRGRRFAGVARCSACGLRRGLVTPGLLCLDCDAGDAREDA